MLELRVRMLSNAKGLLLIGLICKVCASLAKVHLRWRP